MIGRSKGDYGGFRNLCLAPRRDVFRAGGPNAPMSTLRI